jgi:hypothetical protein
MFLRSCGIISISINFIILFSIMAAGDCPGGQKYCSYGDFSGCIDDNLCCNGYCDDGDVCTEDSCESDICQYTPIPGCCKSDPDCDDGRSCTTDTCESSQCVHNPDLMTDPDNCGDCGKQCTGGMQCVEGECVCPSGTED